MIEKVPAVQLLLSYVLVATPRSSVGSTPFAEAQHPFTSGSFSHLG